MAQTHIDKPDIVLVDHRDKADEDEEAKPSAVYIIDNVRVLGLSDEDADFYNNYSAEKRKRVIRKVSFTCVQSTSSPANDCSSGRFAACTYAFCPVPHFAPRQGQHRQRQD